MGMTETTNDTLLTANYIPTQHQQKKIMHIAPLFPLRGQQTRILLCKSLKGN